MVLHVMQGYGVDFCMMSPDAFRGSCQRYLPRSIARQFIPHIITAR
ncbi:alpha/beta hydrolase [Cutibacterium sp.]|nr:alpha/beta hydrolase [Cutibacterium sp.]MCA3772698.1 alpha/beta hydrolase [Cutibacterium sp.]